MVVSETRPYLGAMLMPFLSVTAIGLLAGVAGHLVRDGDHAVLRGFFGAWAGFAAGGLVGLVLDVTTQSGQWVPVLGHLGAVVGSATSQWLDFATGEESAPRSQA